jgi:hypothetical protein
VCCAKFESLDLATLRRYADYFDFMQSKELTPKKDLADQVRMLVVKRDAKSRNFVRWTNFRNRSPRVDVLRADSLSLQVSRHFGNKKPLGVDEQGVIALFLHKHRIDNKRSRLVD